MVKKTEAQNKQNGSSTKVPKKTKKKTPESDEVKEAKKAYQKYVKSKEFEKVRQAVFERDGHRCMFCGAKEEDLIANGLFLSCHHIQYDNCGKADQSEIDDCISLCKSCHFYAHQNRRNLKHFADKSKVIDNIRNREKRKED